MVNGTQDTTSGGGDVTSNPIEAIESQLHDAIAKWTPLYKLAKQRPRSDHRGSIDFVSANVETHGDGITPAPERSVFDYINDGAHGRLILQSRTITKRLGSTSSARSTTSTDSSMFAMSDVNMDRTQRRRLIVMENGYPFLNPRATCRGVWDAIVLIAVLFFIFQIRQGLRLTRWQVSTPLRLAWISDLPHDGVTSATMTIIYVLNIAVTLCTGFESVEGIVFDYRIIATHYIRAWLLIDVVTIFPYGNVFSLYRAPALDNGIAMFYCWQNVAILRMASVSRMQEISNRVFWRVSHATFQFIKMVFLILIGIHLSSCFWMYMAVHGDPHEGTWLNHPYRVGPPLNLDPAEASCSDLYITCLYFAITITSGVGYGDYYAITFMEKVFAIIVMSSSSSLIAFLISEISSLFLKIDISDAEFRNKLELVGNFLRTKKIPPDLITRIEGQYRYYFLQLGVTSFTGYRQILNGLSPALVLEVQMFLNKTIISNVPFLNGVGDSFLRNLLRNISSQVWAKGDYIIHQGEVGNEMYFIRRGKVKAVDSTGRTLTTLEAGQYFGELALLLTLRRTASVIAVANCELFCLSKTSFDNILRDFPEALHSMRQYAIEATYKFDKEKQGVLLEKWTQLSAQLNGMPDYYQGGGLSPEEISKKKYQPTRATPRSESDDDLPGVR